MCVYTGGLQFCWTMETTLKALSDLDKNIQMAVGAISSKKVLVGFDGFVDSIKRAVLRKDVSGSRYYKTLKEFSERLRTAAGKSCQVEMDVQIQKIGGNAPILSS